MLAIHVTKGAIDFKTRSKAECFIYIGDCIYTYEHNIEYNKSNLRALQHIKKDKVKLQIKLQWAKTHVN